MQHFEFPRQSLGFFPTPLHELKNLAAALGGPRLFIKRDDLTGLALGGNKTRKLEYLVGAAVAREADTLITAGAIQSNHCRQTAAAAAKMGMACHLVLGGSAPATANGNLLLDGLLGATIHWAGEHRKGEDIPRIAEELRAAGRRPFIVPYGGSNEIGALGFVEGLRELQEQAAAMRMDFDHIVFASSSGGTHAGLMIGRELLKMPCRLTGIAIDKVGSADKSFRQQIIELANSAGQMLRLDHHFSEADLNLNEDFTGAGYAVIGEAEREAINLCARHEGILVDPVYTGRALAGMIGLIRNGTFKKHEKVLFWHTGGSPALFAYADALQTK
ncbi:MAG TPA: D-cysteine desulfhydrase family protein [Candidatus Rifleibacterium sp.]|nr:D-cysteine desulfhydrase family protein [Candidatus Rifleibacterium sp.]